MRRAAALPVLLALLAACENAEPIGSDVGWFSDPAWDDGAAVVSVFRGKYKQYGEWRDAEVRHYVVREFLDPGELTKDEPPQDDSVPVLKANTLIRFVTGTYEYRQMTTLFFHRKTGALVKAVGTSQEACGTTFQRWDRSGVFRWDTYWSGEGNGREERQKPAGAFFSDELPFVARALDGVEVTLWPSLKRNKVGGGDTIRGRMERDGRAATMKGFRFEYDADGFLAGWKIDGAEEFRRVTKKRMYYWQHHGNGDEKLLEGE